jgi:hypothetical protein
MGSEAGGFLPQSTFGLSCMVDYAALIHPTPPYASHFNSG